MKLDYTLDFMERLCKTESPTGYTGKALKLLEAELLELGMEVYYTAKGCLYTYIKGKNPKVTKILAAHVDTLGAMVKEIKDNGRLVFTSIGGYMGNSVECENCYVHTADGRTYSGTIYTTKPSVHVHSDCRTLERSLENMEVLLDEKVFKKEDVEKLGIDVGDFISFDSRFRITESGFIKSRHLDDKASVAILLGICKHMHDSKLTPENTIQLFFSTYEEVGHGACSGMDSEAAELLCIDMGAPGTGQNTDEYTVSICAKDGSGPYDYEMRSKLVALAKKNDIGYKVDIYPNYSSDASAALRAGLDIKFGLIGPGVYASHSYERTHSDSILNTSLLALAYIME